MFENNSSKIRRCLVFWYGRHILTALFILNFTAYCASGSSLVAYYSFDNAADLSHDDSEHGLNAVGAYSGAAAAYTDAGMINGAADFAGVEGAAYRIFGNSEYYPFPYDINNGVSFSLAVWVKPQAASDLVISSFNIDSGYALRITNGKYAFYTYTDTGASSLSTNVGAVTGQWAHLAMTFEATSGPDSNYNYSGNMTVYANGQMVGSRTAIYRRVTNSVLLGRRADKGFVGLIDDFAVFSGVLTAQEISILASGFSVMTDDRAFLYAAPAARGSGSGSSAENAAFYGAPTLWNTAQGLLDSTDVEVRFLDGTYTSDYVLRDVGKDEHRLTITGGSLNGALFNSAKFAMEGIVNTTMRSFHFTGTYPNYSHYVTPGPSGRLSRDILIEDCTWHDLTLVYGATGVHHGCHHITYQNCSFMRVGPTSHEHMMYHSYNPHHIYVINCYFEDCTGDYVRFRDNTDYGVVAGCYFKSTTPGYNQFFILMPLFNDVNPGNEYFATHYVIADNTFEFYPSNDLCVPIGFLHKGFDPPGWHYLMTAAEGLILQTGTIEQRKQLLLNNCGIDTDEVRVAGNSFVNNDWIFLFSSTPAYGAVSEWQGQVDISDLINYNMPSCDAVYPGDLNGDCRIDLMDLVLLSENWLIDCTYPSNLITPECYNY